MSIQLCILASGSSGNCSAVRTPGGVVLIDCGIGPRTAAARMGARGMAMRDIAAICLTHLDRDHFHPAWKRTLVRHQIRIFCHGDRVEKLLEIAGEPKLNGLIVPFNGEPFEPTPRAVVSALPLPHDVEGSHAFLLESDGFKLGYATDLGQVPGELIEKFRGVDLLAIESNYDPQMQMNSPRPRFLKQRIMGGSGHLSNAQALAAVKAICDRAGRLPRNIVLLHRSQQCNCPRLLRKIFSQDARFADRLILAEQQEPTQWLAGSSQSSAGRQLTWAWG